MPAVQLAELLAELADVETDVARQSGPVGVPFLDAHLAAFEAHENLGVRVRVESRLESDLKLAGIEVVALHAGCIAVSAHVARDADLRVQLSLVALAADELRRHECIGALRRVTARGGRGGAERSKVVPGWGGRRRRRRTPTQGCHNRIEARPEGAQLRR